MNEKENIEDKLGINESKCPLGWMIKKLIRLYNNSDNPNLPKNPIQHFYDIYDKQPSLKAYIQTDEYEDCMMEKYNCVFEHVLDLYK